MFNLKEFVKSGFIKAVGKMADYQIILNAVAWLEKGVLEESDLAEIQSAIDAQYEFSGESATDFPEDSGAESEVEA